MTRKHRGPIRARPIAQTAVALLVITGSACDLNDPDVVCTANIEWGVHVTAEDSLTGTFVQGARLVARDGAYVDTASVRVTFAASDREILLAAEERPGVYSVAVEKDGFLTWERTGLVVTMDDYDCHVVPVELVARLQRAP